MVKISPSILSADFAILGAEVEDIKNAGAEMAHIDVMDGMFVPNMSFAFPIIASLRKVTDIFLDVHLMIEKPERYIDRFIDSGADLITFLLEATDDGGIIVRAAVDFADGVAVLCFHFLQEQAVIHNIICRLCCNVGRKHRQRHNADQQVGHSLKKVLAFQQTPSSLYTWIFSN